MVLARKEGVKMNKGKRFFKKRSFLCVSKKSQGRYSAKMHFCSVILLIAMLLGICTTPDLLLGQWLPTEAAAADVWDGTTTDTNWTGSGTESDPYIITTGAQLAGFANSVNSGNKYSDEYFKLSNDIDLNNKNWTPIGKANFRFSGTFDGDGHTISNLSVDSGDYCGLFGYIDYSTISNLSVSGSVVVVDYSGTVNAGGIVGDAMYSIIENCSNFATITTDSGSRVSYCGGIIGFAYKSTVQYCYNTGSVTASSKGSNAYAGGIVGRKNSNDSNEIIGCYNKGRVTAYGVDEAYAGGLCGANGSILTVDYSYNVGTVVAEGQTHYTGGIVGGKANTSATITITNSYWLDTCGATADYSDGTANGKKTEGELKSDAVLANLNAGSTEWMKDIGVNDGYPILVNNHEELPKLELVYVDSANGEDSNTGANASSAVKTMSVAFGKLNPGGTIKVCSTIENGDGSNIDLDGTALISESGKKVTIEANTAGLELFSLWGGQLTITNLNINGSGTAINCEDTASLSLSNVEFNGTGTSIESISTVNVSGKVVIPKINFSSTNGKIVLTGDLSSGSSIAIQGAGNDHKVVEGNMDSTQKAYFKVLDSENYRLVTKGESNALYYYGNPTWSVKINTDTSGEIRLTPTLTNFVDGDYGDKLKVKILYPTGESGFTLKQGSDAVLCKFSLNNSSWFTDNNQSIDFTSSETTTKTLYYNYDADEPKYSGIYTGTVRFEGTLTEAT